MWFLPTRNRPNAVKELLEAMVEAYEVPKVAVMIDGPMYDITFPTHWRVHQSSTHLEMSQALNTLYRLYPNERWYGLMTDHSRPVTKFWSTRIIENVKPMEVVLVNDTKNRLNPVTGLRRITSASVYGGELIRTLGWVWLPTVVHMYGDDALEKIGHALGVTYRGDVIVKDLLVREGEIPRDGNHDRLFKGQPYIARDKNAYERWLKDFPDLMVKLRLKVEQTKEKTH